MKPIKDHPTSPSGDPKTLGRNCLKDLDVHALKKGIRYSDLYKDDKGYIWAVRKGNNPKESTQCLGHIQECRKNYPRRRERHRYKTK